MKRPTLIVWQQASLDGKLAVSPEILLLHGDERWTAIQGPDEPGGYAWIKAHHNVGATLEGSGSFVRDGDEPEPLPSFADDPAPCTAALYEDHLPAGVTGRANHQGWFMVVDGRGRGRGWIKDGAVFGPDWAGWHLLVLVGHHTPAAYLAYLQREEIPYLVAGRGPVDLGLALEKVKARLGVDAVLSTAGGRLNGALLRAGLVDEVNVEILPAIIGGRETPSLFNAPSLRAGEWPTRLALLSAQVGAGGCVWLRYRVLPGAEGPAGEGA